MRLAVENYVLTLPRARDMYAVFILPVVLIKQTKLHGGIVLDVTPCEALLKRITIFYHKQLLKRPGSSNYERQRKK